jgi:hypothetical protein
MDALIDQAGRALAAGDPLGALKRVALRDDASALALRGIAMAQLGDFPRARALLRDAARAFGPKAPLARARCEGGVAALFPGRSVMGAQRLKDPCAILVREAARRVADAVAGGGGPGAPDPAPLTSGAGPEGGGLRTPTPPPTLSVRASVAPAGIAPAAPAGIAPAGTSAGSGTVGLLWVRRNETRGGDVVLGAGGR